MSVSFLFFSFFCLTRTHKLIVALQPLQPHQDPPTPLSISNVPLFSHLVIRRNSPHFRHAQVSSRICKGPRDVSWAFNMACSFSQTSFSRRKPQSILTSNADRPLHRNFCMLRKQPLASPSTGARFIRCPHLRIPLSQLPLRRISLHAHPIPLILQLFTIVPQMHGVEMDHSSGVFAINPDIPVVFFLSTTDVH